MKDIDAYEAAYRNGYEAGKVELVGKTEQLEEAVGRMAIELAAVICCEKHTGLALARADDFCSHGERGKNERIPNYE